MIQITTVYSRLASSTTFMDTAVSRVDVDTHINSTYRATNQLISEVSVLSMDKLSLSYTAVWDTQAHYDVFKADPIMVAYWALINAYRHANGITHTLPHIVTI